MKRLISFAISIALSICMICGISFADTVYLIPDSNTRYLTYDELWKWDYESLGYILNEIFARHGYVFQSGEKYAYYFNCMPWYTPNSNSDNTVACYPKLNEIEWYNEGLIKEVRSDMRACGDYNWGGKSVWDYFSTGFSTLQGFDYIQLKAGQKLDVYSAPSYSSWRGSNGKARVSTNGYIYAAGSEDGWLLIMYETNNGSVRVGYVNKSDISGSIPNNTRLSFAYEPATLVSNASFTDDPARCYQPITSLSSGTSVTYLTTFYNNDAWDYIETTVNGKTARGFIRSGSLYYTEADGIAEDYEEGTGFVSDEGEG